MIIREATKETVSHSGDVARILTEILRTEDEVDKEREHFWVVGLTTRNGIKYIELAGLGTLDGCLVHCRETFRMAVKRGASSIICAHNHPSGDIVESRNDVALASRLKSAGDILGIQVRDFIIITLDGRHKSFLEAGLLE